MTRVLVSSARVNYLSYIAGTDISKIFRGLYCGRTECSYSFMPFEVHVMPAWTGADVNANDPGCVIQTLFPYICVSGVCDPKVRPTPVSRVFDSSFLLDVG